MSGSGTDLRRVAAGRARPFQPIQTLEVELLVPARVTAGGVSVAGESFGSAQVLVRLHGAPIGSVRVDLGPTGHLDPDQLLRLVSAGLEPSIAVHLAEDQLSTVDELRPDEVPRCRKDIASATQRGPLASVVIPTMRRPEQIGTCVDSVLASSYPWLEVVVVDNSPDDARTKTVIDERYSTDSRVRYLPEPRPGASLARNTGLRSALGPIVAFTDDDVVVDRHWLEALVAALINQPDAVCATGLVMAAELDTREQAWFEGIGGFERGYAPATYRLGMDPSPTLLFPYTPGSMGASNSMAVRADRALALGGFDCRLGPGTPTFGGEDLDLFTRFLLSGGAVTYEPRALAHHWHRRDPGQVRQQVYTYGAGATAMLTKWAMTSPELRSRLARVALKVLSTAFEPMARTALGRVMVRKAPPSSPTDGDWIAGDSSATGPAGLSDAAGLLNQVEALPMWLVITKLAGCVAGPYLWARSATSRSIEPLPPLAAPLTRNHGGT